MANPNTAMRYVVQNPAEHVFARVSKTEVDAYAEQMKAEGRKVRVTRCFNGYQGVGANRKKVYINRCFVYAAN